MRELVSGPWVKTPEAQLVFLYPGEQRDRKAVSTGPAFVLALVGSTHLRLCRFFF